MDDQLSEPEKRRQQAIAQAVAAADQIILEATKGSDQETIHLTYDVALELWKKFTQRVKAKTYV